MKDHDHVKNNDLFYSAFLLLSSEMAFAETIAEAVEQCMQAGNSEISCTVDTTALDANIKALKATATNAAEARAETTEAAEFDTIPDIKTIDNLVKSSNRAGQAYSELATIAQTIAERYVMDNDIIQASSKLVELARQASLAYGTLNDLANKAVAAVEVADAAIEAVEVAGATIEAVEVAVAAIEAIENTKVAVETGAAAEVTEAIDTLVAIAADVNPDVNVCRVAFHQSNADASCILKNAGINGDQCFIRATCQYADSEDHTADYSTNEITLDTTKQIEDLNNCDSHLTVGSC